MTTTRRALFATGLLLSLGLWLGANGTAHASYLDPGSASYLFQLAIAGILGGVFTLRGMLGRWHRQGKDQK